MASSHPRNSDGFLGRDFASSVKRIKEQHSPWGGCYIMSPAEQNSLRESWVKTTHPPLSFGCASLLQTICGVY